jgi:hypothetical protein
MIEYFVKTELLQDGRSVSYHAIVDVTMDMASGQGMATLGSWTNKEDMVFRKPPAFRRLYAYNWVSDSITADAFNTVKNLDEFAEAEMGA